MVHALDGVRVLDLSRAMAGPYCTMMLGDFGADVLKIEPPSVGDESRAWGPPFLDGESYYFMSVNRNKRSMILNLKDADGVRIFAELAKSADIVVENFRPGTTDKLGVGYEALRSLNPRLIYCAISGFGRDGPYRDRPGYDIVAFAMSGIMSITGEADRPPVKMGVPVADIAGGMFAAYGILAALRARDLTGKGQVVDVSLLDGQISWLTYQAANYFGTGENPKKMGSAHTSIAPYQAFAAKDAPFIVAVGNDGLWRTFCRALGLEPLANDGRFATNELRVRHRQELANLLQATFQKQPVRHWLDVLDQAGIPAGPIYTVAEALSDPHVLHRQMVLDVPHTIGQKIRVLGVPIKLSATPGAVIRPPPRLGEHSQEVLHELQYSQAEIARLLSRGTIGGPRG
jgi:formyl-CoA transferase/CoA:oxalate CoA-transferase